MKRFFGSLAPLVLFSLALFSLGIPLVAPTAAQTPALGNQIQVNDFTDGFQFVPAVSSNGADGLVVVWMSEMSPDDGSGTSIRGRRLAANGAMEAEFQVNSNFPGDQSWPAVAMAPDQSFVVVWATPDANAEGIEGQRFGADGAALGGPFQVNTYFTAVQSYPSIDTRSNGDFVVVWSSFGSAADDLGTYSVQGQRFASDGSLVGDAFQVNSYTTGDQTTPRVQWTADDEFVVVWTSAGSSADDTSQNSVQGRRFAEDGTPLSAELQINTLTTGRQQFASLAVADDEIMVVWTSDVSPGSDSDMSSIQGRRMGTDWLPLAGQFQVNTFTSGFQISSAVAALAEGGFVVAWESLGSVGDDLSDRSIQGQQFDAVGAADGGQFQINTFTNSYQLLPQVVADRHDGDIFVVWNSAGSFGDDSDSTSVQGQRFGRRLFSDGFESGTTLEWSNSTAASR